MSAYKARSNWRGAGTGFILNIEELASIFHFPSIEIKAPKLKRLPAKRAGAPVMLPTEEMEDIPHLIEEEVRIPEMRGEAAEARIPSRKDELIQTGKIEDTAEKSLDKTTAGKGKKYVPKNLEAPPNLPI